jgi:hypothetical protein
MKKLVLFSSFLASLSLIFSTGCATKKDTKPVVKKKEGQEEILSEDIIPNSPILKSQKIMTISAKGLGVAPTNTTSPAQALALAKRAAVVDAYRQLGEKMYGIRVDAKDTIRDMASRSSIVKTRLLAVIKNAEIVDETFNNGLYEITMEVKLDAGKWNKILAGSELGAILTPKLKLIENI